MMRLNWFNYLYLPIDGYGRLGLQTVRALLRNGHDVRPFEIGALKHPAWFQKAQGIDFSTLSIQLMPPHNMFNLPGRSIGYSMHESGRLPPTWASHLNSKCEFLLVPSNWIKEVMLDSEVEIPIEVVPAGIDGDECQIVTQNHNRPFTFGCLADRGDRKGWNLVWSAFYKAFDTHNSDVNLIVKCRPSSLKHLDYSYSSDMRLRIWKADVEQISDIYAQMDAYIFPTRAEGLGMPPREAAACGLPVLCTRWSGVADDIDHWATPLEKFKIIDSNMEGCGGDWAEPDLDEIVWRMRDMYEKQDEYKARALKAAQWLRDNRTYEHSAKVLVSHIAKWTGGPMNLRMDTESRSVPKIEVAERTNGHKHEKVPQ